MSICHRCIRYVDMLMHHAIHCKMSFDYIHGRMNHPAFSHFKKTLDHIDTLMRHAAFRH